ncbi:MAG: acyl-CoA dehydrogenase [Bradyrhizobiaceae bacterium]|nr:MAG: acyl-CoA dehydrogenase [Bradyrhizobiaceae bacterium]
MSLAGPLGLPLTPDEESLVRTAAAFMADEIAPNVVAWERAKAPLPRHVFKEYARLGLSSLEVDAAHGGKGASYFSKIRIAEVMARTCMASTFALNNSQGSVTRLLREGSDSQIRRYLQGLMSGDLICAPSLTEPGAGSDFAAIKTSASKVAGGWVINGTKAWVTNGSNVDLLLLYAQTSPGAGASGIASFLVDLSANGVERHPPYSVMGGHAIGASSISFSQVFVPNDDLFAPPGQAFKRALRGITGARTHVAAMATAIVEDSLRRAVAYAGERQAFGTALLGHQGLRWSLADVATDVEAARLLTYRSAHLIATGEDATLEAAQAKLFASEMALRGIATCMQAMGAIGLSDAEPFGRHLASARIAAYVDGTTEIQRDRIGASLQKRYAGPEI